MNRQQNFKHTAGVLAKHCVLVCVVGSTLGFSTRVPALTIELVYQAVSSQEPTIDPNGGMLGDILREAADRWEDILEEAHSLTVNYRYRNPTGGSSATAGVLTQNVVGTRALTGEIQFNNVPTGSKWFYDQSPDDDDEYDLFQNLARDVSPTTLANAYNVTTLQPQLETGYAGIATDAAAQGRTDLLWVAMHELGHLLGVNSGPPVGLDAAQQELSPPETRRLLRPAHFWGFRAAPQLIGCFYIKVRKPSRLDSRISLEHPRLAGH